MNILVLNCGSSSLKYQLINMDDESVLAKGLVERIGIEDSVLTHNPTGKDKVEWKSDIPDHTVAIQMSLDALLDPVHGVIKSLSEIGAVGHRFVNGGSVFPKSVLTDESTVPKMIDIYSLSRLHNPAAVAGITACLKVMPGVPMVTVFDTSFHQTMPKKAYTYGIPYELAEKYDIRRYGFHGTSHRYVSAECAKLMGKPASELKIITCHLGNGSSITAVDGGKCVDTSMGFTPAAGVLMGSRTGDIDPTVISYLIEKGEIDPKELDTFILKKSGFLGISGVSSDMRNVEEAAAQGNERAQTAIDVFYYTVLKYIGGYTFAMGGLDALVFTAGIGENSISTRANILNQLSFLGIELDEEANNCRGVARCITKPTSKIKAFVIPTNEELVIARDTLALISK